LPTISLKHSILESIQSNHGISHNPENWMSRLSQIGCVVEKSDEKEVEIEVFPDRPDLLSHETMARAARAFLHSENQKPFLDVTDSGITMKVDKSLEQVRPVILGAIVRGVNTGETLEQKDEFIQSLMEHQEKLHLSIGRKRKFASIGVHDMSTLKPPFKVVTVPGSHEFKPLAMDKKMSINQILSKHPKGVEYAHLMEGLDAYPVILDSNDDILSFPPIINGDHTTVTKSTTDFFIDVTGWDERSVESCLLLVCLSLAERGGSVESVEVTGWDEKKCLSPLGKAKQHRVPDRLISRILGISLKPEEIANAISKMGGELITSQAITDGVDNAERWSDLVVGEQEHVISMPRWRSDIMHPIDLVEDIAIGYGYENMPDIQSTVHLNAIPLESSNLHRRLRESLRSLSLQETQSLTLSCERDQFERVRWLNTGEVTRISNPITIEHTILRQRILPSLLQLLAANRHHELPQRVYELGTVVSNNINQNNFAWSCAEVDGGFTAAKGFTQAILRDLGANFEEIKWMPIEDNYGPWISGRGARIIVNEEEVGQIGEIDPIVSLEFGLRVPIHAGEFNIESLGRLISDPVL